MMRTVKCKTAFNTHKRKVITRRSISQGPDHFDFLGYSFHFTTDQKKKIVIRYGISTEKQQKYNERIDQLHNISKR